LALAVLADDGIEMVGVSTCSEPVVAAPLFRTELLPLPIPETEEDALTARQRDATETNVR
jgi:hypothetical protein